MNIDRGTKFKLKSGKVLTVECIMLIMSQEGPIDAVVILRSSDSQPITLTAIWMQQAIVDGRLEKVKEV
jgi:hypothetical protein